MSSTERWARLLACSLHPLLYLERPLSPAPSLPACLPACQVYRDCLAEHPLDPWALKGLQQVLSLGGGASSHAYCAIFLWRAMLL